MNSSVEESAPFEVSGFRKVILQGYGSDTRQWAYGYHRGLTKPALRAEGACFAKHRETYTDLDAQAVCEMLNARGAA